MGKEAPPPEPAAEAPPEEEEEVFPDPQEPHGPIGKYLGFLPIVHKCCSGCCKLYMGSILISLSGLLQVMSAYSYMPLLECVKHAFIVKAVFYMFLMFEGGLFAVCIILLVGLLRDKAIAVDIYIGGSLAQMVVAVLCALTVAANKGDDDDPNKPDDCSSRYYFFLVSLVVFLIVNMYFIIVVNSFKRMYLPNEE